MKTRLVQIEDEPRCPSAYNEAVTKRFIQEGYIKVKAKIAERMKKKQMKQ